MAIAASGLKSTQYAILSEVDRSGARAPTIGELAELLVMDQSTVGQNLRPLEREGLVKLVRDDTDSRRRLVTLTRKGRGRLDAARPLWRAAQDRFEARLGRDKAAALRETLLGIAFDPELSAA
ncbi:MarR family winged helix-turn-helix transcriptional regulator [Rhodopseudomonas sp. B29]|uniref:MarR family winged helix-turn-helix transcriptional regulator n=1 Tax=Rhodopseudomonas sp. B29 TaxID=95607 RepID=UPI0019025B13|nr:MarR family winged helix-turn-helix transcriptional regulator [Rhodopseudomonas sp. B29]